MEAHFSFLYFLFFLPSFLFFLPSFLYFFSWSYPHRIFLVCSLLISIPFLSFLLFFFPYSPTLPSFVCSPSFFSFSLYFIFLLSLIFSYLSFSLFLFFSSLFASPTRIDQKWGKLPPTFLPCHLSSLQFSLFLYPALDTWLNVSHSSKFTTLHGYHSMCHSPRVPCGIHMVMTCVTRHSMSRKT